MDMRRMAAAALAWGLCAAVAQAGPAPVPAEVTLTDGRVIVGELVQEDRTHLTMVVGGVRRTFDRSLVVAVERGGPPAIGAAAVGPAAGPPPASDAGYIRGIAQRYRVPVADVLWVRSEGVADGDLPLLFLIAARARVTPRAVVRLRLRGWSWARLEAHYGVDRRRIRVVPEPWGPYIIYVAPRPWWWGIGIGVGGFGFGLGWGGWCR